MKVKLGREVSNKRERPSGPVIATRIPRDVLAKLSAEATAQGTTVSALVRKAAIHAANRLPTSNRAWTLVSCNVDHQDGKGNPVPCPSPGTFHIRVATRDSITVST